MRYFIFTLGVILFIQAHAGNAIYDMNRFRKDCDDIKAQHQKLLIATGAKTYPTNHIGEAIVNARLLPEFNENILDEQKTYLDKLSQKEIDNYGRYQFICTFERFTIMTALLNTYALNTTKKDFKTKIAEVFKQKTGFRKQPASYIGILINIGLLQSAEEKGVIHLDTENSKKIKDLYDYAKAKSKKAGEENKETFKDIKDLKKLSDADNDKVQKLFKDEYDGSLDIIKKADEIKWN